MKKLSFHTSSLQIEKLESLSREESIIQNYALAARALRGDTIYHRYPYIETPSGARLGSYVEDKREIKTQEKSFEIFPNPNNGSFTIQIDEMFEDEILYIEIYNVSGKLIEQKSLNSLKETLEINNSAGLYLLIVRKQGSHEIIGKQRIIKQ